jgi:hypothetical protein
VYTTGNSDTHSTLPASLTFPAGAECLMKKKDGGGEDGV